MFNEHLLRAPDGEKDDKAPALKGIWALEWAGPDKPGALWCGTAPGGLFYSSDLGETWILNEGLWNMPERQKWFGGGTELTLTHEQLPDEDARKSHELGWNGFLDKLQFFTGDVG